MAKYNTRKVTAKAPVTAATSPMGTATRAGSPANATTHEGAPAWSRTAKTDVFLRLTGSFGGEDGFYEKAGQRDQIATDLIRQVAIDDWAWTHQFLTWLRTHANIRTAAITGAVDAVHARLVQKPHAGRAPLPGFTNRRLIAAVCQRADEPGEVLAYQLHTYGRKIPQPIKRGVADAVAELYTPFSFLKYDSPASGVRFGDVLELVHAAPGPGKAWQGDLFKHAIDRQHGHDQEIPESLEMIRSNRRFYQDVAGNPSLLLDPNYPRQCGLTWQNVLSLGGTHQVDKRKLWETIIPSMGYMALLRNLRNFDEAGISSGVADGITSRLSDPEQVRRSRQLPFRFFSAYTTAPSLHWGHALETALDHCLPNIPDLPGRTLVLVDTSGSMQRTLSQKSTMDFVTAAAIFGSALALRNTGRVDLWGFATGQFQVPVIKGGSILRTTQEIQRSIGRVGHGTEMAAAIQLCYAGHDRIILISDMQASLDRSRRLRGTVPSHIPVYAFNLMGYSNSPMSTGDGAQFDLGGLTDATFDLIPRLEAGRSGAWPWDAFDAPA